MTCFKRWNHRKVYLIGIITVEKTFALPKPNYPLNVLSIHQTKSNVLSRNARLQDWRPILTNINYFIEALKGGWARRIIDEKTKVYGKRFVLKN